MRVVVDTNVWVSGLISPAGSPGRVLEAIARGMVQPIASWDLAEEIVEVMRRPRIRRYGITEEDIRDVLSLLAPLLPTVEIDIAARDPDDAPIIAAAVAGRADAIVTGDHGVLDDMDLRAWLGERGVKILSPAELIERLGG